MFRIGHRDSGDRNAGVMIVVVVGIIVVFAAIKPIRNRRSRRRQVRSRSSRARRTDNCTRYRHASDFGFAIKAVDKPREDLADP